MTNAESRDRPIPGPQAGLTPADAPVDVPRAPTKDNAIDDVAGSQGRQRVNPDAGGTWADTDEPAPNKPRARPNAW